MNKYQIKKCNWNKFNDDTIYILNNFDEDTILDLYNKAKNIKDINSISTDFLTKLTNYDYFGV